MSELRATDTLLETAFLPGSKEGGFSERDWGVGFVEKPGRVKREGCYSRYDRENPPATPTPWGRSCQEKECLKNALFSERDVRRFNREAGNTQPQAARIARLSLLALNHSP